MQIAKKNDVFNPLSVNLNKIGYFTTQDVRKYILGNLEYLANPKEQSWKVSLISNLIKTEQML